MSCFLGVNEEETSGKVNIDTLFEKKKNTRFETVVYLQ